MSKCDQSHPDQVVDMALIKFFSGYDDAGKIIRAHLQTEQLINQFIDRHLQNPDALKSAKLGYSQSVDLAIAMGMPAAFKENLKALNEIKNDFAHKVDHEIDKNNVDNFYKILPPWIKEKCQEAYFDYREALKKKERPPKSLRMLEPKRRFDFILIVFTTYLAHSLILTRDD